MGYWIQETEGVLLKLTVAKSGVVWGTNHSGNRTDNIYRKVQGKGGWELMPPIPDQRPDNYIGFITASADGTVLVTDLNRHIYRWNEPSQSWYVFPNTSMKLLYAGSAKHIWAIGFDELPYEYLQDEVFADRSSGVGTVRCIAVGGDGTVCMVDTNGMIQRYIGEGTYHPIQGIDNCQVLRVNSANDIYAMDEQYKIYKYAGDRVWNEIPMTDQKGNPLPDVGIRDFDFASDGTGFALLGFPNSGQPNIYRFIP